MKLQQTGRDYMMMNNPNLLVWLSLLGGICVWILDAIVDVVFLEPDRKFIDSLLFTDDTEIWMRSLIIIVMLTGALFARQSLIKIKHLNKLLSLHQNELEDLVQKRTRELEEKNLQLHMLASTDVLTGINNRRKFIEVLEHEHLRYKRHHNSFTVMMIDIDNFKSVNDIFGHQIGDEVIVQVASIIQKSTRETDCFARWGGEEFILLATNSENSNGESVAEKLISAVSLKKHKVAGEVNISIGITHCRTEDADVDEIILRADKAMYMAKKNGKNQFCRLD